MLIVEELKGLRIPADIIQEQQMAICKELAKSLSPGKLYVYNHEVPNFYFLQIYSISNGKWLCNIHPQDTVLLISSDAILEQIPIIQLHVLCKDVIGVVWLSFREANLLTELVNVNE